MSARGMQEEEGDPDYRARCVGGGVGKRGASERADRWARGAGREGDARCERAGCCASACWAARRGVGRAECVGSGPLGEGREEWAERGWAWAAVGFGICWVFLLFLFLNFSIPNSNKV